jgi:hypothetical protein
MITQAFSTAWTTAILAAPAPTPAPAPGSGGDIINTAGIIEFVLRAIVPLIFVFLGIIFLGRAKNGRVSEVLTSTGIVAVALVFLGGAVMLPLFGGDLVDVLFVNK